MAEQQRTPKPFYKTKADALEDAGITPKQLRTWREEGLFTPELGLGTRYFTEGDVEQLRFLRRLIDELGLRIETVKQLLDGLGERERALTRRPDAFVFLDLPTRRLLTRFSALHKLLTEAKHELESGSGQDRMAEDWLLDVMLIRLHRLSVSGLSGSHPGVYEAARDALLAQLKRMDLVARVHPRYTVDGETYYVIDPPLATDPELNADELEELYKEQERRLVLPVLF